VGLTDSRADVVYLEAPTGPRVELIHYLHPPGPDPPGRHLPHAVGLRHLAFRVQNIDAWVDQLRRGGVPFVSEVQQVPDRQVTFAGGVRKRLVYFRDPEENLLEFCEYR
jgi:catechol 2,3-dioxygenase-like lactoylglutathione lyase family enzyme